MRASASGGSPGGAPGTRSAYARAVEPMSPRFPSTDTSSPASRAYRHTSSSAAMPSAPSASKNASLGLHRDGVRGHGVHDPFAEPCDRSAGRRPPEHGLAAELDGQQVDARVEADDELRPLALHGLRHAIANERVETPAAVLSSASTWTAYGGATTSVRPASSRGERANRVEGEIRSSAGGRRRNEPTRRLVGVLRRERRRRRGDRGDARFDLQRPPASAGSERIATTLPPATKTARSKPGSSAGTSRHTRSARSRSNSARRRRPPRARAHGREAAPRPRIAGPGEAAHPRPQRGQRARAVSDPRNRRARARRDARARGSAAAPTPSAPRDDPRPTPAPGMRAAPGACRVRSPAASAPATAAARSAPLRAPTRARATRPARARRARPRPPAAAARRRSTTADARAGRERARRTAPDRCGRGRGRRPAEAAPRRRAPASRAVRRAAVRRARARSPTVRRAALLSQADQSEQHLSGRLRVGERPVARLDRRAKEVGERGEPDAAHAGPQQPAGEPDRVDDRRGHAAAVNRSTSRSRKATSKRALWATRTASPAKPRKRRTASSGRGAPRDADRGGYRSVPRSPPAAGRPGRRASRTSRFARTRPRARRRSRRCGPSPARDLSSPGRRRRTSRVSRRTSSAADRQGPRRRRASRAARLRGRCRRAVSERSPRARRRARRARAPPRAAGTGPRREATRSARRSAASKESCNPSKIDERMFVCKDGREQASDPYGQTRSLELSPRRAAPAA